MHHHASLKCLKTRTILVALWCFHTLLLPPSGHIYYHTLFGNSISYLFAGIWFGLRAASRSCDYALMCFRRNDWEGFPYGFTGDGSSRFSACVILGLISEREKRAQKSLRESEASPPWKSALGRGHDMKSPSRHRGLHALSNTEAQGDDEVARSCHGD